MEMICSLIVAYSPSLSMCRQRVPADQDVRCLQTSCRAVGADCGSYWGGDHMVSEPVQCRPTLKGKLH